MTKDPVPGGASEPRETVRKVTVDMPARLVDELRLLAEREDRTFSAELRQAVRRHLDAMEAAGGLRLV